jgi:hypothetical protein
MRRAPFLCVLLALATATTAVADMPRTMSYQGVIKDGTGVPLVNKPVVLVFEIYDDASTGALVWGPETHSETTDQSGVVSVVLGHDSPMNMDFYLPYWLEVEVDGTTLTPRIELTAAPYAFMAAGVEPDIVTSIDGVVNDQGDVDLVEGPNISITPDDASNTITIASTAGGDITSVGAGEGLGGGGDTGDVSLAVNVGAGLELSMDAVQLTVPYQDGSAYSGVFAPTAHEHDGRYYTESELSTSDGTDPNVGSNMVSWDNLTDVPAGFADGADDTGPGSDGDWTISGSDMYSSVSGNVGVGTSSPGAKLDVDVTSGNAGWFTTSDAGPLAAAIGAENDLGTGATFASLNPASHWPANPVAVAGFGGSGAKAAYFHSDGNDDAVRIEGLGTGRALHVLAFGDGYAGYFEGGNGIRADNNAMWASEFSTDYLTSFGGFDAGAVRGVYTATGETDGVGVYGESIPSDWYGAGGFFRGGYAGVQGVVEPTGTDMNDYYGVVGRVDHLSSGAGYGSGVWGIARDSQFNYGVRSDAYNGAYAYGLKSYATGATWLSVGVVAEGSGGEFAYGIHAEASSGASANYAGMFVGDVDITGILSKGGGGFKIDHPLDPEGKYLYHSFVESPDMKNVYDGVAVLNGAGQAWVELPDWFETLNRDYRYQLTPIGSAAPDLHIGNKIAGGRFRIAGGEPGMEVSWQVTGIRQDRVAEANRIQVEVDKRPDQIGLYVHPELYGRPPEDAVSYIPRDPVDQKRP